MATPDETRARYEAMPTAELRTRYNSPGLPEREAWIVDEILRRRAVTEPRQASRLPILGLTGLIALAVGGWFLFVAPGADGGDVVNLQRLAIGAALLIVGALWIAAQWRPR